MENRVLLIDGNSVLVSAYHGANSRWNKAAEGEEDDRMKTKDGLFTGAVFGMTKTLLRLIEDYKPSHIAIAWDVSRNTFRRDIYPEYKGTRGDTDEELVMQFPIMRDMAAAMGIPQFRMPEYEADDLLGTLAAQFENEAKVAIVTKDRDALQLVSPTTKVWLNTSSAKKRIEECHGIPVARQKKEYPLPTNYFSFNEKFFRHYHYGLSPKQLADVKGLDGDKSDNIPGVSGVGEKAIFPLLAHFGSIEALYEYVESTEEEQAGAFFKELGVKRNPYKSLVAQKESAFLSKKLATIKRDVDIPDAKSLDDIAYRPEAADPIPMFEMLEFRSLLPDPVG